MNHNLALKNTRQSDKSILLIFLLFGFFLIQVQTGFASASGSADDAKKLLSRINLSSKALGQVHEASDNPERAVSLLLKYYRDRTFVKHPVDRTGKDEGFGKSANATELQAADNALKHIFVGQSAYPPYFCGNDIDWGTRPVPDNEWVWQLNRMNFWDDLASAYWHTRDEKYAKEWCNQLVDWTLKNPNDENHKYAWRSIEAGIRGNRWTFLFQYFIDSPNFTPEVLTAFLNSCYDHAAYLMTQYRTKSNWGLMEAEGLAFIAMTFPEFRDAGKWQTEAIRRLNIEIDLQVYPDGHQRELAMGYHLGCIQWFIRTYDLARMNGRTDAFPPSYVGKVQKMCEVPMKLCHPDGTNPQFGDAWAGKPGQHAARFQEWEDRFNRPDFLFLATEGQQGKKPDSTAWALPQSGLYSMRSSWAKDAVCLVLKCGPDGGGHCQPDNGTFELSAGGRNLMPDGGSYIYSGDPVNRAWFRQTKVHQTLTLNGENSKYAPRLLLWKPGQTNDILVVENQSYENLKHRRSLFFVEKKYFIIVDEAIGLATGNVDIHFQLAPGTGGIGNAVNTGNTGAARNTGNAGNANNTGAAGDTGNATNTGNTNNTGSARDMGAAREMGDAVFNRVNFSVRSNFTHGWNVLVQTLPQPGLELSEEEGQVSFLYTKKEPRPAFCYRIPKSESASNVRFVTVVAPYEKEIPKIKVRIAGDQVPASSQLTLEIEENGIIKQIGYTL